MGKDWAKGLTKATDARIARMADGHRGAIWCNYLARHQAPAVR